MRGTTPLAYALSVTNAGPGVAGAASVSQTLPAGVTFASAAGSGWTCGESAGVVTCTRPGLVVGAAPNISVQVTPGAAAALLACSASVSAPEADPNPANNSDSETTTVNRPWSGSDADQDGARGLRPVRDQRERDLHRHAHQPALNQANNPGHELAGHAAPSLILVSASATSGTAAADLPGNGITWNGSHPERELRHPRHPRHDQADGRLGTTVANQGRPPTTPTATAPTRRPRDRRSGQARREQSDDLVVVSPPMALYTFPPCRLLDTRDAPGAFGGPALLANADRSFICSTAAASPPPLGPLREHDGHPADPAGNLRLYPAGTTCPTLVHQLHGRPNAGEQRSRAHQRPRELADLLCPGLGNGTLHPGRERLLRVGRLRRKASVADDEACGASRSARCNGKWPNP